MDKKKIIIVVAVAVLLIVAVLVGFIIHKVSILNDLTSKGLKTRALGNYHMRVDQELENGTDTEVWAKDNEHFLVKMGKNSKVTMYRNGEEKLTVYELYGQKSVNKNSASLIEMNTFTTYMATKPTLNEVLKTSIRSVQFENKDCYEITLENNTTVWVEKETALVIKAQTSEGIAKFTYEIGTVTDADIQKPDLNGATEMN